MEQQSKPWWFMWPPDETNIYCEDGQKRPLKASDHHLTWGKYDGLNLEEVTDEGYLWYLRKKAKEEGDWFLAKCLSLKV